MDLAHRLLRPFRRPLPFELVGHARREGHLGQSQLADGSCAEDAVLLVHGFEEFGVHRFRDAEEQVTVVPAGIAEHALELVL